MLRFSPWRDAMAAVPIHNAVCWLLSALMLVSSSAPVICEHSHQSGGEDHSHFDQQQPADTHHHCADDCVDHHDGRHPADHEHTAVDGAPVRHAHVMLFGIDFHIPQSSDPSQGEHESHLPSDAFVPSLQQRVARNATTTLGNVCFLIALDSPGLVILPVNSQNDRSPAPVQFAPLCDAARLALTGVLRC